MDTGFTPVQFGNNSTMGTNDVFKQISSNKTSSTGNKGLADLYKKYFGDSKTTSSNNSPKIDANTGNSFYDGLANLGQFLGIGRNVNQAPVVNEYLTGDRNIDESNLFMRHQEAMANGADPKVWNWNDMRSNLDKAYQQQQLIEQQNLQKLVNSVPDNGEVLPYGTYSWGGN